MGTKKPAEIAEVVACSVGVSKCNLPTGKMFVLAIFAGVYIGFGAILATTVTTGLSTYAGLGFAKFMGGAVFTVGLMLVVLCGAELFTGNNLIVTAKLDKKVTWKGLGRNWLIVYLGNFVGAMLLVLIYWGSFLWSMGNYGVGANALKIADSKVDMGWGAAFCRGILCNILVCLAVWMAISAEDTSGKIAGMFFPIMAFVAMGFEHSVANMYFIPIGILLKDNAHVVAASGLSAADLKNLNWWSFIWNNLIPVTLGNIVGGAIFVAALYWYVYRKE